MYFTVRIYSSYSRQNLDLPEQGCEKSLGNDDVSSSLNGRKYKMGNDDVET